VATRHLISAGVGTIAVAGVDADLGAVELIITTTGAVRISGVDASIQSRSGWRRIVDVSSNWTPLSD